MHKVSSIGILAEALAFELFHKELIYALRGLSIQLVS
jgi:hypothetical protein